MALQIPNITTMYMGPSSEVYPYGNYNLTSVATTQIISFAGDYLYGTDTPADEWKTLAAECSLSPCVRTYQVNVTQGVSSEVLLSTTPMQKASDYPGASYTATPMPCLINGTPHPATSFTTANTTNTFPVTGLLPNNATAYLPKECYFLYASPLGLQEFLPSFLTGTVDAAPEVDASDPAWLGTLWADGNVSLAIVGAAWASLADSMTANMRRNGDASNSAPAAGVALRTETCISVRWAWLAFPAALLLLTVVFLVVTIVESAGRAPGRMWKGSPLALLFHGLDGEVGERYGAVGRVEDMEAVAKRVRVRMGDEGRGLKLVEVKEHPV
ncbi:uncharacterized protein LTHEOB_5448 [Neofusicoccum parvum]|uniref:Uncharacterized protein LTHEOB_5448 n=1 Tax=Neofusicoccum parvum TaxID=310453 RepID=A0ACB5SMA1_9PEZI|nr:uncharacterized protein LTHEOB_5448 [Neofusicoccum parvum]